MRGRRWNCASNVAVHLQFFNILRLCGGRLGLVGRLLRRDVGLLIRLVWAIDGDLHGNLASLDLLAVHLCNRLLLHLLRGKGDEAEAATLASLAPSLQLLDHESRDGSKRDLG